MQEIIKQAGSSGQLFETVNFAFMKIFDFLVKKALFWTFLLFLGDLRHKCSFTKSQFSQGAINLGFQTKHILNP